jgi:hypothetical protein
LHTIRPDYSSTDFLRAFRHRTPENAALIREAFRQLDLLA